MKEDIIKTFKAFLKKKGMWRRYSELFNADGTRRNEFLNSFLEITDATYYIRGVFSWPDDDLQTWVKLDKEWVYLCKENNWK